MFYNTPLCELLEQRVVEIYSRNDAAQQNSQPVQSSRLPWEDRLWMSCGRDAASEAAPGMGSSHCESLFEKYQAASRLSIKRVIATYTNVSLVLGNSS
jgi:hypothetical protein